MAGMSGRLNVWIYPSLFESLAQVVDIEWRAGCALTKPANLVHPAGRVPSVSVRCHTSLPTLAFPPSDRGEEGIHWEKKLVLAPQAGLIVARLQVEAER